MFVSPTKTLTPQICLLMDSQNATQCLAHSRYLEILDKWKEDWMNEWIDGWVMDQGRERRVNNHFIICTMKKEAF